MTSRAFLTEGECGDPPRDAGRLPQSLDQCYRFHALPGPIHALRRTCPLSARRASAAITLWRHCGTVSAPRPGYRVEAGCGPGLHGGLTDVPSNHILAREGE